MVSHTIAMAGVKSSYVCPFCELNFTATQILQEHVGECGNSLIICIECGMAIQRRLILKHNNVCPAQLKKQLIYLKENDEAQIEALRNDSLNFQRQLQFSEERNQIFTAALHTIRSKLEEFNDLYAEQHNFAKELSNSIAKIEGLVESLKNTTDQDRINYSHLEFVINTQESKIRSLNNLVEEVSSLKNDVDELTKTSQNELENILKKIDKHDELLNKNKSEEDQLNEEMRIKLNTIETNFKGIEDEISKIKLLKFDLKEVKSQGQENSLKVCEINEKTSEIENKMFDIENKQSFALYTNLSDNSAASKSGHLIWRIDDFNGKMKSNVDDKVGLFSQIFYSHEYGYALQAEVHLNGLGKWRGRHITASVFIVNGDYDPILPWPVSLNANILLKDQTPNRKQAIDFIKPLTVKRRDTNNGQTNDESIKKQYIFIPHTSLDKLDYIKNNTIFIEVIIKKS